MTLPWTQDADAGDTVGCAACAADGANRLPATLPTAAPRHAHTPNLHHANASRRGAVENLILLEDHLNDPAKFCLDCIGKHAIAAQAYLKEAASLDGGTPKDAELAAIIADAHANILRGQSRAPALRAVRRALVARLNAAEAAA